MFIWNKDLEKTTLFYIPNWTSRIRDVILEDP